ncbi:MAG TPA: uroporphyrinogen-III synthase [Pyrinomonadaceae bacterium]|jgi:uroporphyrinogen-III synthase
MKSDSQPKTFALLANPAHRKLVEEIEKTGSKVFQFQPLGTESVESETNFDNFNEVLKNFDWIVFSDVFAVDYFLEALSKQGIDFFELDEIRVLAYGEAVADRLRYVQLHADIITTGEETGSIFSSLTNYIGASEITNMRFYIPIPLGCNSALSGLLNEAGASVSEAPIYKIVSGDKNEVSKLKTLLKGGAIDEFIFTSPEDVFSLKKYVLPETINEILIETAVSATNEITLRALTENGLPVVKFKDKKRG